MRKMDVEAPIGMQENASEGPKRYAGKPTRKMHPMATIGMQENACGP
jgi:hypothetical protein